MKWLDKKDGKTQTMDNCMDNKPERRSPLIDWLMGVEQNSVYLSRILVVGCAGLFDCEELVGGTHRRCWGRWNFSDLFHYFVPLELYLTTKRSL